MLILASVTPNFLMKLEHLMVSSGLGLDLGFAHLKICQL